MGFSENGHVTLEKQVFKIKNIEFHDSISGTDIEIAGSVWYREILSITSNMNSLILKK